MWSRRLYGIYKIVGITLYTQFFGEHEASKKKKKEAISLNENKQYFLTKHLATKIWQKEHHAEQLLSSLNNYFTDLCYDGVMWLLKT